jgi:hypothetical protein
MIQPSNALAIDCHLHLMRVEYCEYGKSSEGIRQSGELW